jgi:hypothetical protein
MFDDNCSDSTFGWMMREHVEVYRPGLWPRVRHADEDSECGGQERDLVATCPRAHGRPHDSIPVSRRVSSSCKPSNA